MEESLKSAFMITVFGYSAPTSDASAVDILKGAWRPNIEKNMEQIEIIDIRESDDLRESWDPFIHTHHYDVHADFYKSWIARHPRRTGEAYWNQYYEAKFVSANMIPRDLDFPDIFDWYRLLIEHEQ